jgi:hypothetical protein
MIKTMFGVAVHVPEEVLGCGGTIARYRRNFMGIEAADAEAFEFVKVEQ